MTGRRRRCVVSVTLACSLGLAACSDSGDDARVTGAQGYVGSEDGTVLVVPAAERETAPDLAGELIGGGAFSLAEVRGDDVVVVNVWGSWCAPCRAEAATLEAVYRDLQDEGVLFVGLNTRDQEKAALAFLAKHDVTYPNLDDNSARLQLAFRDSLPSAAIPTTWVIDRQGRVAARSLSGMTEDRLRGMLEPILAETAADAAGQTAARTADEAVAHTAGPVAQTTGEAAAAAPAETTNQPPSS